MASKQLDYCYWCGKPATSREHVPPKCLFPEDRDIRKITNKTYRSNLITVPSCDEHNMEKSRDDEYLMVCLASRVGNNLEAFVHTKTKVCRTRDRFPSIIETFGDGFLEKDDTIFSVQHAHIDMNRLYHSFEAIARALHYYEFGSRYEGECKIITRLNYNPKEIEASRLNDELCTIIENEMPTWDTEVRGDNPCIFTYQFGPFDGYKNRILSLTFYEETKVYIGMSSLNETELKKLRAKMRIPIALMFGVDNCKSNGCNQ